MKYTPQELQETFAELLRELAAALDGEGCPRRASVDLHFGRYELGIAFVNDCRSAVGVPSARRGQ